MLALSVIGEFMFSPSIFDVINMVYYLYKGLDFGTAFDYFALIQGIASILALSIALYVPLNAIMFYIDMGQDQVPKRGLRADDGILFYATQLLNLALSLTKCIWLLVEYYGEVPGPFRVGLDLGEEGGDKHLWEMYVEIAKIVIDIVNLGLIWAIPQIEYIINEDTEIFFNSLANIE